MIEIGDDVLVFHRYEGTVTKIENGQAIIYCPDFDEESPWLVTDLSNVTPLIKRFIN